MNDDDFEAALRRADPARETRDERTEEQRRAALAAIVSAPRGRRLPRRARVRPAFALAAAAAAVVAGVVGIQLWHPAATAHAATPPLLDITPVDATVEEVLDDAVARLDAAPDAGPRRGSSTEGWYIQIDVGESESSSVISPQRREYTWNDDLSGRVLVTAGESYSVVDGVPAPPDDPTAPEPGTVLVEEEFAAGDAPVSLRNPPSTEADELRTRLAVYTGTPPRTAGSVVSALRSLLDEWTLGPRENAALLELLREHADDLTVAGEVVDRLGRPGIALRSSDRAHFDTLLILSAETGAPLALETIYVGGLDELDLEPPSVVEYILWR